MLLGKLNPPTKEAATALGFYELGDISDPEKWWEAMQRDGRTYWWFPAEAVTAADSPGGRAWDHRYSKVRSLSLETRLLWALAVGRAQAMRTEAQAYSAAMRGLFRRKLASFGFHGPAYAEDMEQALRAFLKGQRVEVSRPLNTVSTLMVEGRTIAYGPPALPDEVSYTTDRPAEVRVSGHPPMVARRLRLTRLGAGGSNPEVV